MTRSPIDQMTSKLWDFQTWESQLWGFKRIIGPIVIMIINLWRITRKTSKLRSRLWFHQWVIWWLEGGFMWKKQTKWPQRISRLETNMHKITLRASLIIIPSCQHGQQQQSKYQKGYIIGIDQRRQQNRAASDLLSRIHQCQRLAIWSAEPCRQPSTLCITKIAK